MFDSGSFPCFLNDLVISNIHIHLRRTLRLLETGICMGVKLCKVPVSLLEVVPDASILGQQEK